MRRAGSWWGMVAALATACAGPAQEARAPGSVAAPAEHPAEAGPSAKPAEPNAVEPAQGQATPGAGAAGERSAAEAGAGAKGTSTFPRPDELARLARKPSADEVFTEQAEDVEGWALLDPPPGPPPLGDRIPDGPWEQLLAAHARKRAGAVRLTEPMACLARQVGRFVLVRKVRPGPATLSFMSARCGVAETVGLATVAVDLHGGETDEDLQPVLARPYDEHLRQMLARGRQTAGVWYGRTDGRALVMLVTAEPLARLEAFPWRPGPDGRVVVKGELLRPAARLSGLVTRGRFGFRSCEVDPGVALPRFSVRCEVDPQDPAVTLEIAAFAPHRIFGPVVVAAQLWPGGAPPATFAPPALAAAPRAPVNGDLRATLTRLLGEVRREAGLPPVTLAGAQSETAAALAPHFFAAAAKRDEAAMETIVLGLRAGWQVPGYVRAGLFTYARSDDLDDAGKLLAVALARPSGREALLHPEVQTVAIGALREARGVGVVFAGYALIDRARAVAEAEAVMGRLDAERARRGVGKAEAYPALQGRVAEVAASIERGDADPHVAVKSIMPRDGQPDPSLGFGQRFSWIGSGDQLETLKLPAPLLEARSLRVAVAVAHCRLDGSPWARFCVVIGALEPKVPSRAPRRK
jgi:hypothetical protein